MKYFIGLKFEPHFLQFKKIDSFRRRFDNKYRHGSPLIMSLIPPFSLDKSTFSDKLLFDIEDEIDSQLIGLDHLNQIEFSGVDVLNAKKKLLYLKPKMPKELCYAQQAIIGLLKECNVQFKNKKMVRNISKNGHNGLLPLGRFENVFDLTQAINQAKLEFSSMFKLKIKDVSLYIKSEDSWVQRAKLFEFSATKENINPNPQIII